MLTQYCAFLDVHVGRHFVERAGMRLSFPYFIGNAAWRFMHTSAEIACAKGGAGDAGAEQGVCDAFKAYFGAFATMYCCPYCRHHLNAYVIKSKESWAYPIEYTLLGWRAASSADEDFARVSIADKLATVADGAGLRLLLWKLHNAVNSSIYRQENWYRTDDDAVYTSRWWPNVDGELQRARLFGGGVVGAGEVERMVGLLKLGVRLNEQRDDLLRHTDAAMGDVLKTSQGYIARLDEGIVASGFLQRMYTYDAARVDPEPAVSAEEAAHARTEDFIQGSGGDEGLPGDEGPQGGDK